MKGRSLGSPVAEFNPAALHQGSLSRDVGSAGSVNKGPRREGPRLFRLVPPFFLGYELGTAGSKDA